MKKIIEVVDGKEKGIISLEEANEKINVELSPLSFNNAYRKELIKLSKGIKSTHCVTGFDLEGLIEFLQKIHAKFGNMDVLYFNGRSRCYTRPILSDIDVVKKHFTLTGNLDSTYMNIKNDKALSLFHG